MGRQNCSLFFRCCGVKTCNIPLAYPLTTSSMILSTSSTSVGFPVQDATRKTKSIFPSIFIAFFTGCVLDADLQQFTWALENIRVLSLKNISAISFLLYLYITQLFKNVDSKFFPIRNRFIRNQTTFQNQETRKKLLAL